MGNKNNKGNSQHHLPYMDYAERKKVEFTRLEAIRKRVELAQSGNLLEPQRYYLDDVLFLLEVLQGDS